jgi:hypothetical protein
MNNNNNNNDNNGSKVGFILLRHVRCNKTNLYWQYCYECIRRFYKTNPILIIDDNSDLKYVTEKNTENTFTISSEYKQRGELLPFIYLLKLELDFKIAVFIHDSVFFNRYIDFENVNTYLPFWNFKHYWDQIKDETRLLETFQDKHLLEFYNDKSRWNGIFGCMCAINISFLRMTNKIYNLHLLIPFITTRYNRSSFERVLGAILHFVAMRYEKPCSPLFGNIHQYCRWGISLSEVKQNQHLPLIKVWTGR